MATQTSLYLDIGVIVITYILVLVFSGKKMKIGLWLLLGGYLVFYSYLVFFSRRVYATRQLDLNLFWSYREAFDGFRIKRLGLARQIFLNILLYIPLGMILVSLFPEHPVLYPLLIGLGLSITTEAIQYASRRGLAELDDVFNNVLGLLIGIGIMVLTRKIITNSLGKNKRPSLRFGFSMKKIWNLLAKDLWIVLLDIIAVNAAYFWLCWFAL